MLLVTGELERGPLGKLDELAVHARPREALLGEVVEERRVLALATAHDRSENLEPGALGQVAQAVDDLLGALAGDQPAAVGAVGLADARIEQAQVVVDLRDGPDRRAGVARRGLLVDGDRGRQPLDEVHVRLVHLPEELPGVRRQRLDVAPLALGVDRVERERRLARARQPGEHDEAVARELYRDVLEVVLAGPANNEGAWHGRRLPIDRAARVGNRGVPACARRA